MSTDQIAPGLYGQRAIGYVWNSTTLAYEVMTTSNTGVGTDVNVKNSSIAITTAALPLPSGASTSALQTTGNSSLSSIDTKTPALVSGRQPVDGSGVTQPVSGTVTTTPPANASANVAQVAGTTADTNSGLKSAGTIRVVIATDQPALTNKLLVTPDSVALPANQSVNVNQIAGSSPAMKAASTAAVAADPSLVVALSPATGLPELRASTTVNSSTAAVNTALTATLAAPGAGLFHYITSIIVEKLYSVVGVAAGAGVIITTTDLGGLAWTTEQLASVAGTVVRVVDYRPTTPLKSAVVNTASTIVCPQQLQTIWRITVTYFIAP